MRKRPQFESRAPITSAQRPANVRQELQRFLIVCEGEKTEPLYFKSFHQSGLIEVTAVGTGMNTQSLVAEAIQQRAHKIAEARKQGQEYEYDQCWCVFDRDSFPAGAFNNAIRQAEDEGFQVAYSNEAFELWYLLHFDYHDAALDRGGYKDRLTARLGRTYAKNDPAMHALLEPHQEAAIRNAQRLLATHADHNPQRDNPCTTVHRLVQALRENSTR